MGNLKNQIIDLLSESCSSAPELTHGLKNVGDGNMKKGILTVADFFEEVGLKKGVIIGTASTLTVVGLIAGIKKVFDMKKKHKAKGEKIVQGLKQGIKENSDLDKRIEE